MEAGAKSQDKAAQAKAPPAGDATAGGEDLSMEEILQSIRRIITEDDKDGKKTNGAKKAKDEDDVPGSDVFELTEMVKEDGSVVNVKAEAAEKDVLTKIDAALTPEVKAEPAPPAPAPVATTQSDIDALLATPAAPEPAPVAPPAPVVEAPPAPIVEVPPTPVVEAPSDSLLSEEAAAASISSLNKLKNAEQYVSPVPVTGAPGFRDGTTMEDLVTEMLRPMMKTWLDANLPQIVERIVEREVRKLTK